MSIFRTYKTPEDLIQRSLGRSFAQKSDFDSDIFFNKFYPDEVFTIERSFKFMGMEKWSGVPYIKKEMVNMGGWAKLQDLPGVDIIAHAERKDMLKKDKVRSTDFHKEMEAELKRQQLKNTKT